jgi:hypothetical protein
MQCGAVVSDLLCHLGARDLCHVEDSREQYCTECGRGCATEASNEVSLKERRPKAMAADTARQTLVVRPKQESCYCRGGY